jgi:hypothetical protein
LEALQLFDIAACSIGGVFYTGAVWSVRLACTQNDYAVSATHTLKL